MTEKRKKQLFTMLSVAEIFLFFTILLAVFALTTGLFTKSKWQAGGTQPSKKTFTKDALDTFSIKNMPNDTTAKNESTNILLPSVNAATLNETPLENQTFSENDIMIQANELLIFDEL